MPLILIPANTHTFVSITRLHLARKKIHVYPIPVLLSKFFNLRNLLTNLFKFISIKINLSVNFNRLIYLKIIAKSDKPELFIHN